MVCPDCLSEVEAAQESCAGCGYVRPADGWTPDPLTGLILGGRYRLEGRLGAGGPERATGGPGAGSITL